jgi:hypothetical protein
MSEVDLEGLQDAAKNSTEELEEAFPFLIEGVDNG